MSLASSFLEAVASLALMDSRSFASCRRTCGTGEDNLGKLRREGLIELLSCLKLGPTGLIESYSSREPFLSYTTSVTANITMSIPLHSIQLGYLVNRCIYHSIELVHTFFPHIGQESSEFLSIDEDILLSSIIIGSSSSLSSTTTISCSSLQDIPMFTLRHTSYVDRSNSPSQSADDS